MRQGTRSRTLFDRTVRQITSTIAALALGSLSTAAPSANADESERPRATFETSHGSFVLELDQGAVPETVANFIAYVRDGFYEGTIFHRVIAGFMIQGGGFTPEFQQSKTRATIRNEADRGGKNDRGSIAMARTSDPHSATAQFFINVVDNDFLNHRGHTPQGWGYAVFGRVVEGMDTVDRIAALETGSRGSFQDVPRETVVIQKTRIHQDD
jgi:peptidyl-prolyl cis-trans isomerase B (cyclophilin B)